jgi:hypothetical protein
MVGLDWRLLIATSAKFLFLVSSRAEESGGFASAPVSSALQIGLRQAFKHGLDYALTLIGST